MESSDVRKTVTTDQEIKVGRPYVAPNLKPLSPAAAKDLLLQHADAGCPEVQNLLECVDELQGEKGS